MFLRHACLLVASALSIAAAHANVYTVGADAACTHTTIDAAVAAAADGDPLGNTIHVASNQAYDQQAISIQTDHPLDIIGGFANCSQAVSDGSHVIIDGAGGAPAPVMRITLSDTGFVHLSYLTIQHGDAGNGDKGGGIYVNGTGSLELNHCSVAQNAAGYGGGIYAEGHGAETRLIIGEDVSIVGNTAHVDGGGVVNDGAAMTMIRADSYIAVNHAPNGYGGGLLIRSGFPANVDLGSSGLGDLGPIYLNDAAHGGGVALYSVNNNDTVLHLFTTDPARPVRIRSNTASIEGGGIYLGPMSMVQQALTVWARDTWIEDNIAPHGAAIANRSAASTVAFNDPGDRPPGSVDCPVGMPCGGIVGNAAEDESAVPTGGIVETDDVTFSHFNRMTFEGNVGASVIQGSDRVIVRTQNVAITGNSVSGSLIETDGDSGEYFIENTTIGGNSIGDDIVLRLSNVDDDIGELYRTIIWQPGKTTLHLAGHPLRLLDDMVSERDSIDGGDTPYVVVRNPRFVDPGHGDYSLRAGSPAIDSTTSVPGDDLDLYSHSRDVALPITANFGVRDLGAIERQTLQPLVLNPDFDADLRLWSATTAGVTTWDATNNAAGGPGSGSAHVTQADSVTGTLVGGLVQCVHLPGPGTYTLNGWGHGTGTAVTGGDIAELYWEFRKDGGEGCTSGTPDASGTMLLSSSNGWSRPAMPTDITVAEPDWTYTSSIAVTLVAVESGPSGAPTNAWFDGITLGVRGEDLVFTSGFDP